MAKKWVITIDEIAETGDFGVKTSKTVEGNTPVDALNNLVRAMCVIIKDEHEAEINDIRDVYTGSNDVPF